MWELNVYQIEVSCPYLLGHYFYLFKVLWLLNEHQVPEKNCIMDMPLLIEMESSILVLGKKSHAYLKLKSLFKGEEATFFVQQKAFYLTHNE